MLRELAFPASFEVPFVGQQVAPSALLLADVDADGEVELVVASTDGCLAIFKGLASGSPALWRRSQGLGTITCMCMVQLSDAARSAALLVLNAEGALHVCEAAATAGRAGTQGQEGAQRLLPTRTERVPSNAHALVACVVKQQQQKGISEGNGQHQSEVQQGIALAAEERVYLYTLGSATRGGLQLQQTWHFHHEVVSLAALPAGARSAERSDRGAAGGSSAPTAKAAATEVADVDESGSSLSLSRPPLSTLPLPLHGSDALLVGLANGSAACVTQDVPRGPAAARPRANEMPTYSVSQQLGVKCVGAAMLAVPPPHLAGLCGFGSGAGLFGATSRNGCVSLQRSRTTSTSEPRIELVDGCELLLPSVSVGAGWLGIGGMSEKQQIMQQPPPARSALAVCGWDGDTTICCFREASADERDSTADRLAGTVQAIRFRFSPVTGTVGGARAVHAFCTGQLSNAMHCLVYATSEGITGFFDLQDAAFACAHSQRSMQEELTADMRAIVDALPTQLQLCPRLRTTLRVTAPLTVSNRIEGNGEDADQSPVARAQASAAETLSRVSLLRQCAYMVPALRNQLKLLRTQLQKERDMHRVVANTAGASS